MKRPIIYSYNLSIKDPLLKLSSIETYRMVRNGSSYEKEEIKIFDKDGEKLGVLSKILKEALDFLYFKQNHEWHYQQICEYRKWCKKFENLKQEEVEEIYKKIIIKNLI